MKIGVGVKGIAFIQSKGGVGKTSLCHALALGASWHDVPAYIAHTDNREPMVVNNRPYQYLDARDPEKLMSYVDKANKLDGYALFIVDSGGNRPEVDRFISNAMDLIILPVTPDPESVTMALECLERIPQAKIIINRWSSNHQERKSLQKYIDRLPQDKIIGYVADHRCIRILREDDKEPFKTPPTVLNNLSRNVHNIITNELIRMVME